MPLLGRWHARAAYRTSQGRACGRGRPWWLPPAERVPLVAVYYRTDLTMRQLAPLFGVSPATVCRVMIQQLREIGASSRNYRFSARAPTSTPG